MNRLYMDGVSLRLVGSMKRMVTKLDQSRYFLPIAIVLSIAVASLGMSQVPALSGNIVTLLVAMLLMPLFPFHGIYVKVLTGNSKFLGMVWSILMPLIGIYFLSALLPTVPPEILKAISVIALFGALYGSVKALAQDRIPNLLAHCGLALNSILWWQIAYVGKVSSHAFLFAISVSLVIGGLFLAWDRIRNRFGDLKLNQIGGLFVPMPGLSLCIALLVMAGVGLPPFGLFVGYVGMLLGNSIEMSPDLVIVFLVWFTVSLYLFQFMRRLLFGPHHTNFRYQDLNFPEIATFAVFIVTLIALSGVSHEFLTSTLSKGATIIGGLVWN